MFSSAFLNSKIILRLGNIKCTNVVGYAGIGLTKGISISTSQFIGVGEGQKFLIESMVPQGSDTYDNITICRIDSFGTATATYSWTSSATTDGNDYDKIGWIDVDAGDYMLITGIEFDAGDAFWTQGSSTSQSIQTAGQVNDQDVSVQLRKGIQIGGNPFPAKVKVNDVLVIGEDTYDNVTISKVDEFGAATATYSWTSSGTKDGDNYDLIGWIDVDAGDYMILSDEVVIEAGEGLWMQGSVDKTEDNEGQYITFPAPEL